MAGRVPARGRSIPIHVVLLWQLVDISERKQLGNRLRNSDELFRVLYECSGDAQMLATLETGNSSHCGKGGNRRTATSSGQSQLPCLPGLPVRPPVSHDSVGLFSGVGDQGRQYFPYKPG